MASNPAPSRRHGMSVATMLLTLTPAACVVSLLSQLGEKQLIAVISRASRILADRKSTPKPQQPRAGAVTVDKPETKMKVGRIPKPSPRDGPSAPNTTKLVKPVRVSVPAGSHVAVPVSVLKLAQSASSVPAHMSVPVRMSVSAPDPVPACVRGPVSVPVPVCTSSVDSVHASSQKKKSPKTVCPNCRGLHWLRECPRAPRRPCPRCSQVHWLRDCPELPSASCFRCGGFGHRRKDCTALAHVSAGRVAVVLPSKTHVSTSRFVPNPLAFAGASPEVMQLVAENSVRPFFRQTVLGAPSLPNSLPHERADYIQDCLAHLRALNILQEVVDTSYELTPPGFRSRLFVVT